MQRTGSLSLVLMAFKLGVFGVGRGMFGIFQSPFCQGCQPRLAMFGVGACQL